MSFNTIFYIHTRKKKHRKIVIVRKTKIINLRSWKSKYSRSFTVEVLLWNKCDLWLQLHPRHFCFNHLITSWNMFFAFDVIYIYMLSSKMCSDKGESEGSTLWISNGNGNDNDEGATNLTEMEVTITSKMMIMMTTKIII